MENALHVMNLSKYKDFDVQTSLFSYRISTRIFAFGDRIPLAIIEKVRELQDSPDLLDNVCVSSDPIWDVEKDEYSTEDFSGIEVETYAFQDAGYIHAAVGKIVEDFLNTHKRVTTYVSKY